MRLSELEPEFFRIERTWEEGSFVVGDQATWEERGRPTEKRMHWQVRFHTVDALTEAAGIRFLCPKCFVQNKGKVGTHGVHVYFSGRNVPAELNNGVTWAVSGSDVNSISISPSILLIGGCAWHGFITNGEVTGA